MTADIIMKDKLIKIKRLKQYNLYIDDPIMEPYRSVEQFCGTITKSQVEHFLKTLSKYDKTPESCCFKIIKAVFTTKTEICVNLLPNPSNSFCYDRPQGNLKIHPDAFRCKCSPGLCLTNLKNGKCQDDFIRNTIGKILFEKAYSKEH